MDSYRILVVDDEPGQRHLIRDTLAAAEERFEVTEAADGTAAVEILRHAEFDAILCDKSMPRMSGDQLCRHVRRELGQPLMPIIMVTGTNSPEELAASFEAGATDFINKPYRSVELLARLRHAVHSKRLTDQLDSAENLLFTLARLVEAKDETTGDHCSRLAHVGSVYGRVLGLSDRDIDALRRGGVLHDIGKLGIPDSILLKAGPLDADEWVLMRHHTVIGAHLCDGLASMRSVRPIILHHHERLDGSGYPDGLAGDAIPLLAQVFQIADIYDALASDRPYKKAFSIDRIIGILQEEVARGWRSKLLVDAFIDILRRSPGEFDLPDDRRKGRDETLFAAISATGVVDWDRKRTLEVTA